MVTVGPFPSQLLWNVDDAQPSVLARQHLTNLLRPVVWSTGSKNEFNLSRYLLPWLSRMLDELRAPKNEGGAHRWEASHTLIVRSLTWCSALKFLVLASLNPVLFFHSFSATSRQKFYIFTLKNRRYLIIKTCLYNRVKLENKEN